jgi:hypothetical protein
MAGAEAFRHGVSQQATYFIEFIFAVVGGP